NISKTQEDVQEEIKKTIASPDSRSDNRTTDKASLGALVLTGPVKRDDRKAGGKKPGSTVVSSIPTAVAGKATTKARKLPAATDAISRVVPPDAGNPAGSTVSTAPAGVKMVEPAPEVVSAPAAAEISSTPEIRKGSKKQSKKKKWS